MAANPTIERRPEWTDARYAHEVARTKQTTRDDWWRFWLLIQRLAFAILFLLAAYLIPTLFNAYTTDQYDQAMQATAHWVQQP